MTGETERARLDQWLWRARFFKTRTLAAAFVAGGGVRLTRAGLTSRAEKAHAPVGPGDILTFARGGRIISVRIRGIGARRGPAAEARALYDAVTAGADAGPGRLGENGGHA